MGLYEQTTIRTSHETTHIRATTHYNMRGSASMLHGCVGRGCIQDSNIHSRSIHVLLTLAASFHVNSFAGFGLLDAANDVHSKGHCRCQSDTPRTWQTSRATMVGVAPGYAPAGWYVGPRSYVDWTACITALKNLSLWVLSAS